MLQRVAGIFRSIRRGGQPRDSIENTPLLTRETGRTRSPKEYSRSKRPSAAVSSCPICLKPLHYDNVQGYCPEHGEPEARRIVGSGDVLADTDIEAPVDDVDEV
jgi:hypothetical protein